MPGWNQRVPKLGDWAEGLSNIDQSAIEPCWVQPGHKSGLKFKLSGNCTLEMLEDVPLVEFMYLVFTRVPMRVIVGDSALCCCVCVTCFERLRQLSPGIRVNIRFINSIRGIFSKTPRAEFPCSLSLHFPEYNIHKQETLESVLLSFLFLLDEERNWPSFSKNKIAEQSREKG